MRHTFKSLLAIIVLLFAGSDVFAAGSPSNTALGIGNPLPNITTGQNNTVVGNVSSALTTGSNNVLIGATAACDVASATTSDSLAICGASSTPVLAARSTSTALPSMAAGGNPLVMSTLQNISLASVNTSGGYTFLPGVSGRTVTPTGLIVTASGTAAAATSVFFQCTSGALLASFPIAALVTKVPVTPFSSTGTNAPLAGVAFASSCASGDGVLVSVAGSALTTTTNLYVNMPFIVQ